MSKNIFHNVILLGCFALVGSSCATPRQADVTTRPAAPPLLAVTYRKSGGLAGLNEWVTVSPAGHLQLSGRLSGEADADLTPAQLRALATAFVGWDALRDEYLPDHPTPDAFTLYIRYGTKGVTVLEPAPLPPRFRAAVAALESTVRSVGRPR